MPTRFDIVGDMHLGRRPHRLDGFGASPSDATPAIALGRLVDRAVADRVDAVLFAGDLVDRDDDLFEAYGVLESAVRRLLAAGIRVLAVAGNHDAKVLPRLVDRVAGVELLGRGGRWQCAEVGGVGVVGWSFPAPHHAASPLESDGLDDALADARGLRAAIGLVHADLDAGASRYAPVSRRALADLGLGAWFVGHVHRPDAWGGAGGAGHVGYLGSLVGLDRGELGARGPWRVTVDEAGRVDAQMRPVGPVVWHDVELDVTGDPPASAEALNERVLQALIDARAVHAGEAWDVVAVQLHVVGEVDDVSGLATLVESLSRGDGPRIETDDATVGVTRITHALRPRVDLDALSGEATALGVAARLARTLDDAVAQGLGDEADLATVVAPGLDQALADARAPLMRGSWHLGDDAWTAPTPVQVARDAAWRLVRDLLAQRS